MSAKTRLNKTRKYSVFDLTGVNQEINVSPKTVKDEDPCNTNCTAYYENKEDQIITCSTTDDVKAQCFTSDGYEEFYSNINWNKLSKIEKDKFEEFNQILTNEYKDRSSTFHTLFNKSFSIVDNKLKEPRDRLNYDDVNDLLFRITDITSQKGDDKKYCGDINYSFSINVPTKSNDGFYNYRLFHIALHSKASKYVSGNTRSKYSCKYFEKKTTAADTGDGSGPFHYKIDNPHDRADKDNKPKNILYMGVRKAIEKYIQTEFSPFKSFMIKDDAKFENNDNKFIKPPSYKYHLNNDDYALHNYIYNKFVDFWNNNILPDVRKMIPKSPKSTSIKIQKHVRSNKTAKSQSPKKNKNKSLKRSATI